jgi:hypothetical protein
MAKAYERASKRVDAVSEALLAELIQRDVQQLTEDALGGLMGPRGTFASRQLNAVSVGMPAASHMLDALPQRRVSRHTFSAPCSASGSTSAFCSPPYAAFSTVSVD